MMKRSALAALFLACAMVGCGPRVGDEYIVRSSARLFHNEGEFREAVQLEKADVSPGIDWMMEQDMTIFGSGNTMRILASTDGGAKVIVTSGDHGGKIGWVTSKEIHESEKR